MKKKILCRFLSNKKSCNIVVDLIMYFDSIPNLGEEVIFLDKNIKKELINSGNNCISEHLDADFNNIFTIKDGKAIELKTNIFKVVKVIHFPELNKDDESYIVCAEIHLIDGN